MPVSVGTQIRVSLWRHYLMRLRTWPWILGCVFMCLLPLGILTGVRMMVPSELKPKCEFRGRSISLNAPIQLLQSLVCNIDNKCHQDLNGDEVFAYPGATINDLLDSSVWDVFSSTILPPSPRGSAESSGRSERLESLNSPDEVPEDVTLWEVLSDMPEALDVIKKVSYVLGDEYFRNITEKGIFLGNILKPPDEMDKNESSYSSLLDFDDEQTEYFLDLKVNPFGLVQIISESTRSNSSCSFADIFVRALLNDSSGESTNRSDSNVEMVGFISDKMCEVANRRNISEIIQFVKLIDWNGVFQKLPNVLTNLNISSLPQDIVTMQQMYHSVAYLAPLSSLVHTFGTFLEKLVPFRLPIEYLLEGGWTVEKVTSVFQEISHWASPIDSHEHQHVSRFKRETRELPSLSKSQQEVQWRALIASTISSINITSTSLASLVDVSRSNLYIGVVVDVLQYVLRDVAPLQKTFPSYVSKFTGMTSARRDSHSFDSLLRFFENNLTSNGKTEYDILLMLTMTEAALNITQATDAFSRILAKSDPDFNYELSGRALMEGISILNGEGLVETISSGSSMSSSLCSSVSSRLPTDHWLALEERLCSVGARREVDAINSFLRPNYHVKKIFMTHSDFEDKVSQLLADVSGQESSPQFSSNYRSSISPHNDNTHREITDKLSELTVNEYIANFTRNELPEEVNEVNLVESLVNRFVADAHKMDNNIFMDIAHKLRHIYIQQLEVPPYGGANGVGESVESVLEKFTEFSSRTLEFLLSSLTLLNSPDDAETTREENEEPLLTVPSLKEFLVPRVGIKLISLLRNAVGEVPLETNYLMKFVLQLTDLVVDLLTVIKDSSISPEALSSGHMATLRLLQHIPVLPTLLGGTLLLPYRENHHNEYTQLWPCSSPFFSLSSILPHSMRDYRANDDRVRHSVDFRRFFLDGRDVGNSLPDADNEEDFDSILGDMRMRIQEFEMTMCHMARNLTEEWTVLENGEDVLQLDVEKYLEIPSASESTIDVLNSIEKTLKLMELSSSAELQWLQIDKGNFWPRIDLMVQILMRVINENLPVTADLMISKADEMIGAEVTSVIHQVLDSLGSNMEYVKGILPGENWSLSSHPIQLLLNKMAANFVDFVLSDILSSFNTNETEFISENEVHKISTNYSMSQIYNIGYEIYNLLYDDVEDLLVMSEFHDFSKLIQMEESYDYLQDHLLWSLCNTIVKSLNLAEPLAELNILLDWFTNILNTESTVSHLLKISDIVTYSTENYFMNKTLQEFCKEAVETSNQQSDILQTICVKEGFQNLLENTLISLQYENLIANLTSNPIFYSQHFYHSFIRIMDLSKSFSGHNGNSRHDSENDFKSSVVVDTIKQALIWLGLNEKEISHSNVEKYVATPHSKRILTTVNTVTTMMTTLVELFDDTKWNNSSSALDYMLNVIRHVPEMLEELTVAIRTDPVWVGSWLTSDSWCVSEMNTIPTDSANNLLTNIKQIITDSRCTNLTIILKEDLKDKFGVDKLLSLNATVKLEDVIEQVYRLIIYIDEFNSSNIEGNGSILWNILKWNFSNLAPTAVGISNEEYWSHNNRHLILSSLINNFTNLNNLQTKTVVFAFEKGVKLIKLGDMIMQGGDVWSGIKNFYGDKPLVIEFSNHIEEMPFIVNQYLNLLGLNYRHLSKLVISSFYPNSSLCSVLQTDVVNELMKMKDSSTRSLNFTSELNRTVLDHHLVDQYEELSDFVNFICSNISMTMLYHQLDPFTSPMIGEFEILPNTATLSVQIDELLSSINNYLINYPQSNTTDTKYWYKPFQLPKFMEGNSWDEMIRSLNFFNSWSWVDNILVAISGIPLPPNEMLDTLMEIAYIGVQNGISVLESDNNLHLSDLAKGLPTLQKNLETLTPYYGDIVAMFLWLPNSKLFPLYIGSDQFTLKDILCHDEYQKEFISHFYDSHDDFAATFKDKFCSYSLDNFLMEYLNAIANGNFDHYSEHEDLLSILDIIGNFTRKYSKGKLVLPELQSAVINNVYTNTHWWHASTLEKVTHVLHEVLILVSQINTYFTYSLTDLANLVIKYNGSSNSQSQDQSVSTPWSILSSDENEMQNIWSYVDMAIRPFVLNHSDGLYLLDVFTNPQVLQAALLQFQSLASLSSNLNNFYQNENTSTFFLSWRDGNRTNDTNYEIDMQKYVVIEEFKTSLDLFTSSIIESLHRIENCDFFSGTDQNNIECNFLRTDIFYNLLNNLGNITDVVFSISCPVLSWIHQLNNSSDIEESYMFQNSNIWQNSTSLNWHELLRIFNVVVDKFGNYSSLMCKGNFTTAMMMQLKNDWISLIDGSNVISNSSYEENFWTCTNMKSVGISLSSLIRNIWGSHNVSNCSYLDFNNHVHTSQFKSVLLSFAILTDSVSNDAIGDISEAISVTLTDSAKSLLHLGTSLPLPYLLQEGFISNTARHTDDCPDGLYVDINRLIYLSQLNEKEEFTRFLQENFSELFFYGDKSTAENANTNDCEESELTVLKEQLDTLGDEEFIDYLKTKLNFTEVFATISERRMWAILSPKFLPPVLPYLMPLSTSAEIIEHLRYALTEEVAANTKFNLLQAVKLIRMQNLEILNNSLSSVLETLSSPSLLKESVTFIKNGVEIVKNYVAEFILRSEDVSMSDLFSHWSELEESLANQLNGSVPQLPMVMTSLKHSRVNLLKILDDHHSITTDSILGCGLSSPSLMSYILNTMDSDTVSIETIFSVTCGATENEAALQILSEHFNLTPVLYQIFTFVADKGMSSHGVSVDSINFTIDWIGNKFMPLLPKIGQLIDKVTNAIIDTTEGGTKKIEESSPVSKGSRMLLSVARMAEENDQNHSGVKVGNNLGSLLCGGPITLPEQVTRMLGRQIQPLPMKETENGENESSESPASPGSPEHNGDEKPRCRAIYQSLNLADNEENSDATSALLSRFVAPFMKGKILYSPMNTATHKIVANLQAIFSEWSIKRELFTLVTNMFNQTFVSDSVTNAATNILWLIDKPQVMSIVEEFLSGHTSEFVNLLHALSAKAGITTTEFSSSSAVPGSNSVLYNSGSDSTTEVTSDSTLEFTSDSTSEFTSDSTSDFTSDSTSIVTSDSTSIVTSDSTSIVTSDSTSDGISDLIPLVTSDSTSYDDSDSTSYINSDSTSIVTSDSTSAVTYDSTSVFTSDSTSDVTLDSTSDVTSDSTSNVTSDSVSVVTPDFTSDATSDPTSDVTSDSTSVVTPDSTSDVTSDSTSVVTLDSTSVVTSDSTSVVTLDSTSDVTSDATSVVTSDSTSVVTLNSTSDVTLDSTSDVTSDSTSNVTSDSGSVVTSDSTSAVTYDSTSVFTSDSTSDVTSDSTSIVTSDSTSIVTSDSTSVITSDSTSDVTLDSTSDVTSDFTSDATSDSASVVTSDSTSVVTLDSTSDVTSDSTSVVTPDSTSVVTSDSTSVVTLDSTSDVTSDATSVVTSDSTSVVTLNSTSVVTLDSTSDVTSDSTSNVTSDSASVVTSDSTSDVTFDSTSAVTSDSTSVVISDSTSDVTSDSTSEDTSDSTLDVTSDSTSVVTSDSASVVTSDSTSDVTFDSTSAVTSDSTSVVTSDSTSDVTSDSTLDVTSDSTSVVTLDSTSDVTSDATSNVTSDSASVVTSDSTSEATSDSSSDATSDSTSDVTSDSTSDVTSYSSTEILFSSTFPMSSSSIDTEFSTSPIVSTTELSLDSTTSLLLTSEDSSHISTTLVLTSPMESELSAFESIVGLSSSNFTMAENSSDIGYSTDVTVSESSSESYASDIPDTVNIIHEFQELVSSIAPVLEMANCFEMNRFQGVNSSADLLEESRRAYEQDQFMAAIIFDSVTNNNFSHLPHDMAYTIRVDGSRVPNTQRNGPTFWRPGPYADYGDQLLYHQGFIILQNMIDEAIMKAMYEQSSDIELLASRNENFVLPSRSDKIQHELGDSEEENESVGEWQYALNELKKLDHALFGQEKVARKKRNVQRDLLQNDIKREIISTDYTSLQAKSKTRNQTKFTLSKHSSMDSKTSLEIMKQPKAKKYDYLKYLDYDNILQEPHGQMDKIRTKRSSSHFVDSFLNDNLPDIVNQEEEAQAFLKMSVHTVQQPYPCYYRDIFLQSINESPALNLLITVVAFLCFESILVKQLIDDKLASSKKLDSALQLDTNLPHLSWLLYSTLLLLLMSVAMGSVVKFCGLQPLNSLGVIVMIIFTYGLTLIALCYIIGLVFNDTLMAIFTICICTLLGNVPFVVQTLTTTMTPLYLYAVMSLFSPSAFGFGFRILCQYELSSNPCTFDKIWTSPTTDSDMTLGFSIVMLVADTCLMILIAIVIHATKSVPVWQLTNNRVNPLLQSDEENQSTGCDMNAADIDPGFKQSLTLGLRLTNVRKEYKSRRGERTVALRDVTLDLYEGQVVVLLGHNGAGKSTLVSLIAGEISPTSGSVYIPPKDSEEEKDPPTRSRGGSVGFAPQDSALPSYLKVQEVLQYYAALKGVTRKELKEEVVRMLSTMGLTNHRHHYPHQLSGGLLRRLSVAIAFIGHSPVVILDEPTSGVDPVARRDIWQMIATQKSHRTIFITTHCLEETETLADRITIIDKGNLVCVGTPQGLKIQYGGGYSIIVSRKNRENNSSGTLMNSAVNSPISDKDAGAALLSVVREFSPDAVLTADEEEGDTLTFRLPYGDTEMRASLPTIVRALDSEISKYGFYSLEVLHPSLEEVMASLKVIDPVKESEYLKALGDADYIDGSRKSHSFSGDSPLATGVTLWLKKLYSVLYKHSRHDLRDSFFYMLVLVVPLGFVVLAAVVAKVRPHVSQPQPIVINEDTYGPPSQLFTKTLNPLLLPLRDQLLHQSMPVDPSHYSSVMSNVTSLQDWAMAWPTCEKDRGENVCGENITVNDTRCFCSDKNGSDHSSFCSIDLSESTNVNDWVMSTRRDHTHEKRYGFSLGVTNVGPASPAEGFTSTLWYDNSGYHTLPVALTAFNNARLRRLVSAENVSITVRNEPILFRENMHAKISLGHYIADLSLGLLMLLSVSVLCCYCVSRAVDDRLRGFRCLLHSVGVSLRCYWCASLIWDTFIFLISIILAVLILLAFGQPHFVSGENLYAFVMLSVLYGLSLLPLLCLFERFFSSKSSAVVCFFMTIFSIGFITTTVVITCQVYSWVKNPTHPYMGIFFPMQSVGQYLQYSFLLFQPYIYVSAIKDMALMYTKHEIYIAIGLPHELVSPFSFNINLDGSVGLHMALLSGHFFVWTLFLFIIAKSHTDNQSCKTRRQIYKPKESVALSRCDNKVHPTIVVENAKITDDRKKTEERDGIQDRNFEDTEVANEKLRILEGWPFSSSDHPNLLQLKDLTKVYKGKATKVVLQGVYLSVNKGDCVGLLGTNGAGKSTIFKCLAGEIASTYGSASISGHSISSAPFTASDCYKPLFSYCPQSNTSLDPLLTPLHHFTIMCHSRGILGKDMKDVILALLYHLRLSGCENKQIFQLSAGTKRKILLAMSFIGDPQLLLLDEPTDGLDISSRHNILSLLKRFCKEKNRGVLMTSHNLEDATRICSRVGVLSNGELIAIGSPRDLMDRYSQKLTMKIRANEEHHENIMNYLHDKLNKVEMKRHTFNSLIVQCSSDGDTIPVDQVYSVLESAKRPDLGVEEYTITLTDFNEVFKYLTSEQDDSLIYEEVSTEYVELSETPTVIVTENNKVSHLPLINEIPPPHNLPGYINEEKEVSTGDDKSEESEGKGEDENISTASTGGGTDSPSCSNEHINFSNSFSSLYNEVLTKF